MRPDAATPTAPDVINHGVLAAAIKKGALDPADGALALRHREEEQHGTYRIAKSPLMASNHWAARIRPISMSNARRVRTTVPSENAARTSLATTYRGELSRPLPSVLDATSGVAARVGSTTVENSRQWIDRRWCDKP